MINMPMRCCLHPLTLSAVLAALCVSGSVLANTENTSVSSTENTGVSSTRNTNVSITKATGVCGFEASVQFNESAPRDSFRISNTSSGNWFITALSLDMSTSAGNLIFDVTAEGAGVEVFQPFRADDGEASLLEQPSVLDGDQRLILVLAGFATGVDYRFTIDVDDQLSNSELGQIRVAASEMSGAQLTLDIENASGDTASLTDSFDDNNRIVFQSTACQ